MAKSTNVGAVDVELGLNSSNYDKQLNNKIKGTESAFSSSFGKIGALVASAFAVKTVANFTKKCIDSASKVQSAFTGLNSIVQGTGNSFSQAQDFINKYTADGLVSVEETATAYKNLLSRGYDSSQIEDVLNRLKDSAAFGRQASYDLGEAVVTATEGLKNENSILVDNAGVTKNVAKMWDEYAKSIGKSSTALTQQEKIQAEYKGIMNETKFQVGDAANYTKTFAGQIQQLKFNFSQMTVAIGKVVTPLAQLFIPVINTAITAITRLFEKIQVILGVFGLKMPNVISKASNSITGVGESSKAAAKDAVNSAKKMNKAFSGLDEIHTLSSNKNSGGSTDNSNSGGGIIGTSSSIVTPTMDSSSISSSVDNIMAFIEPLKNISFDNLLNAFDLLKNSAKELGGTIWDGLKWIYFNLLIPLSKWTIEDILPSFLDILSGALNILNKAIEDVKPLFGWIWESFLKPIANWTGGVITSALQGIGDALNWISKNEIAMSILEGIGIAIGVIAGAIAIYNGVMTVCNVVTGVFSAIMTVLTSPITLVVLAIGALIAIIILCVKHWDDIKNACVKAFETIKTTVQNGVEKVKNFFNRIIDFVKSNWQGLLLFIVNPFAGAFKLLYDNCEGFRNTINNVLEKIKTAFSNAFNSVKTTISNIWNSILKIFSKGGKIFDGIKDGIANVFKTIVNGIITGTNKVISLPFKSVNKMLNKIRNSSFLGVSPFKDLWKENPLPVPQIPKLAKGGYAKANNPQLAIIGDNKREGEIVSPESKIYEQALKAIKDSGTTGKQEIEITIYHKYEDGKTIIQKINQAQIDAGKLLLVQ